MHTPRLLALTITAALALAPASCADLPKGLSGLVGGAANGELDAGTIADGLKEALRVGTERAVGHTSQVDGFLANELIRIAVPDELSKMTSTLRKIGLGKQVDELIRRSCARMATPKAWTPAVTWRAASTISTGPMHIRWAKGRYTNTARGPTSHK